jgi:hypothetical protein
LTFPLQVIFAKRLEMIRELQMLRGLSSVNMVAIAGWIATVLLLSLSSVSVARGSAYGELGQVGGFGQSSGQFTYPSDLAVDPTDNSVYVLDEPAAGEPGAGPPTFRIQKFAAGLGAPVAHAEIATPEISGHKQVVDGIAVDAELQRLYVLKGIEIERTLKSAPYVAEAVEAYSTIPNASGELQQASDVKTGSKTGVLYEFQPVPKTGTVPAEAVRHPAGIAVDKNHGLLVLGDDEAGNTVIQQIAVAAPTYASGATGETFDDTGNTLARVGSAANGIAVASDGSVYATAKELAAGGGGQGVARMTIEGGHSLAHPSISPVRESSNAGGPGSLTGGRPGNGQIDFGAQVAVSSDGGVVYAMQSTKEDHEGLAYTSEGSYEVRGMSTSESEHGSTKVVFGGGPGESSPKCHISSTANAIAAGSGGVVYALDEGDAVPNFVKEVYEPTPYGFHVVEFGPNGSGCPIPIASFEIDGKPSEPGVTIHQGDMAKFNASGSQLNGEEPVEVQWDLDGSGKYEHVVTGSPASLETSLKYLTPGHYTIGMKILLKGGGNYGDPAPVTGTLVVEPVPPVASFEVFPSANHGDALQAGQRVAPGESIMFNGVESSDPVGSPSGEPTKEVKTYTWEFGDGKVETKSWPETEYTRSFANAGSEARQETVTLTVENKDGTKSAPVTQTLTIAGTEPVISTPPPSSGPPASSTPPASPLPLVSPVPPVYIPPAKKPLTRAQKLARALKLCKKEKPKRRRLACEKAARKKYGPKKITKK